MTIIMRLLTSKPFRFLFFLLILAGTGCWFIYGIPYCQNLTPEGKSQQVIKKMTQRLKEQDPEAAVELARLQSQYDPNAMAAVLQQRFKTSGSNGLKELAEHRLGNASLYDLKLAELAINPKLVDTSTRDSFFTAHSIPFEQGETFARTLNNNAFRNVMAKVGDDYLKTLTEAAKDPELWVKVRENPMMVFLLQNVSDRNLLDFYDREKSWLDDVLFVVLANFDQQAETGLSLADFTNEVLTVAKKNHPRFRQTLEFALDDSVNDTSVNSTVNNVSAEGLTASILATFSLFSTYGETITHCVEEGGIPLQEFVDVLFANQDYIQSYADESSELLSARLMKIKKEMPHLWALASKHLLLLNLAEDVPQLADSLAEKYGAGDIAVFLYSKYAEELSSAALSVERYGELGIYILNRYERSDVFHRALTDHSLGVRIIPYTAKFGDSGLEKVAENSAWLDKYFDREGNPKVKEWWTILPVGSAFDVARNWATGQPTEASELGWAALDVADVSLLVLTLGTSAPVTAARSGAATATKTAVKLSAKELAEHVTVGVTRTGERVLLTTSSRTAARTGTEIALRSSERKVGRSLFRSTMMKSAGKSIRLVPVKVAGKTHFLCSVAGAVSSASRQTFLAFFKMTRGAHLSWRSLPAATRHVVYRSLLYTGLVTTILFHTVPELMENLPAFTEQVGTFAGNILKNGTESLTSGLVSGLNALLGESFGPYAVLGLIYGISVLLAVLLFWRMWRFFIPPRERKAFVA